MGKSNPKPRKPDAPLGAGTLTAAELDAEAEKVYRLFKRGNNRASIGRALGMTTDVVDRRIQRARRNLGEEALGDLRTDRESALLDMIREAHRNLDKAETVAERNACVRTIADLHMKLSKLLGLEMPAKVTLELEKLYTGEGLWGGEVE